MIIRKAAGEIEQMARAGASSPTRSRCSASTPGRA